MDALLRRVSATFGAPVAMNSGLENPLLPLLIAQFKYGDCVNDLEPVEYDAVLFASELLGGATVRRYWRRSSSTIVSRIGDLSVFLPDGKEQIVKTGQSVGIAIAIRKTEISKWIETENFNISKRLFYTSEPELERCAQRSLVALREGDGNDPLLLSSIAGRISARIRGLLVPDDKVTKSGLSPKQVRRISDLIISRITHPAPTSLSLDAMAAEVNLSLYHFSRAFRQSFGIAPYAYVLRKRLERARTMLVLSDARVSDIARCSGFASHANFTEKFRREMGVTPTAFRFAARG